MARRGDIGRAWLPALAYMALIFVVSSFEVQFPPANLFPLRDKGIHFVEYAVLGVLCAHAAHATWSTRPIVRIVLFATFVSTLYGLSDELHQALVPGRSAEVADFVADALGSLAGAASWAWWWRRRRR